MDDDGQWCEWGLKLEEPLKYLVMNQTNILSLKFTLNTFTEICFDFSRVTLLRGYDTTNFWDDHHR